MEKDELLMHVWTKTTGLTESELREKIYEGDELKDDAGEILINLDAERVSKIKGSVDKTEIFNDAYKKATKDEREKLEKKFKAETGFESDLQGMELFKAWGETLKVKPTMSEDEIKTHPKYLELEKTVAERYETEVEKAKRELEEYKSGVEKNIMMSSVLREAESAFINLNPVLSEDPVRAKNQKDMFLDKFKAYDYEFVDGKYLVKENGKRVEDSHGNAIYLDGLVANMTSKHFDTRVQNPKDSPSNKKQPPVSFNTPKTKEEYNKAIAEAGNDDQKLVEIGAAWKKYRAENS